jgi:uncharacterized membrane protein
MSGAPLWFGIALLATVTLIFKAIGPVTSAGRRIPPQLEVATALLPTALIAALVVTQTFESGFVPDARILGVVAAMIAVALRAPFALVVLAGAATAALLRGLGVG